MTTPLYCSDPNSLAKAKTITEQFGLAWAPSCPELGLYLLLDASGLQLKLADEPNLGGVQVDFAFGRSEHRRKYGGGEAITKALGIKKGLRPKVLDGTAGLGRDAFVVANLGCDVTMVERNPAVAALLDDGILRATQSADIGGWVGERLHLIHTNSLTDILRGNDTFDVVYLDPMFPHKKKSAQVKKEMRLFQLLVGTDLDADGLLSAARSTGASRIVVKRPIYAGHLNDEVPNAQLKTKSHRFDIYLQPKKD